MDGWMDGLLAILLFSHNNMQLNLANWAYDRICWTGKLTEIKINFSKRGLKMCNSLQFTKKKKNKKLSMV